MVTMIRRRKFSSQHGQRRAVLLLVVLSVLTLFLMLGATYLAVARRARMASKAFADNITASSAAGVTERKLVDDAFLAVVRGTKANTAVPELQQGKDLLGDKYGYDTALIGNVTAVNPIVVGGSDALLELTVTGLDPPSVSDLNGCVLTFTMPGLCASTRVLQAYDDGGAFKVVVAAGPTVGGASITKSKISTTTGSNAVVINGREFSDTGTNEAYDGFDGNNELLTQIADETVFGVDVNGDGDAVDPVAVKSAPINAAATLTVDNDADGWPDSTFLDVGLAPIVNADDGTIYPRAAVLVLDLDGRLNVNVHGSDANLEAYNDEAGGWPNDGAVDFRVLPRGSGVGPAEVSLDRSLIFSPTAGSSTQDQFIEDGAQVKGGRTTLLPYPSGPPNVRETPQVGSQFGRYGGTWDDGVISGSSDLAKDAVAKPGVKNQNDNFSHFVDYWRGGALGGSAPFAVSNFFLDPGRYGSPYDWKGRMRVYVSPSTGEPIYYKPLWNGGGTANELVDDPYEVDLTATGPRGGPVDGNAIDNLFSAAELEGLLRYYDSDSLKLARRLVALCGEKASTTRSLVTTDSWDTPAVTGKAWEKIIGSPFASYLSDVANSPFSAFSPETIQGLKFDINRPFHDPNLSVSAHAEPNDSSYGVPRRQEYAKQLFCLLVAVTRYQRFADDVMNGVSPPFDLTADDLDQTTTRQLAQFAVNVVDFRDQDAVMTPFDYMSPEDLDGDDILDTEEDLDGDSVLDYGFKPDNTAWAPNARVWGCERPELLITETHAWHDRRTDDEAVANKVVENDQSTADKDFDQLRRPFGAFFVELMAPQSSQAKEYDSGVGGVVNVGGPVDSAEDARAEPIPEELVADGGSSKDRFEAGGTIDVAKRTPLTEGPQCPIWRIVSVRGDVYGGTAFNDTTGAATMAIRDPASDNAPSTVDRVFYFAAPPAALQNPVNPKDGRQGGVFWASQAPTQQPTRTNYIVVGTNGPQFDFTRNPLHADNPATANLDPDTGYSAATPPTLPYVDQVHLRFDSPSTTDATKITPATISEPIHVGSGSDDPYNVIATAIDSSNVYGFTNPSLDQRRYSDSYRLTTASNAPFDSFTGSPSGISSPFLTKEPIAGEHRPLLMINGTHPNFAVVHLQRLADPTKPHDTTNNPYLTVDSMPVDLTVVNTKQGNRSVVQDEPGRTPTTGGELTWLQEQNHFRRQSIERGGKADDSGATFSDIWSRRVRNDISDVEFEEDDNTTWDSQEAYRSPPNDDSFPAGHSRHKATPRRAALGPVVSGSGYVLQDVPASELGSHVSTLRTTTTQDPSPSCFPTVRFPWLAFHNRPFVSGAEISLVPTTSTMDLGARHTTEDAASPSPGFYHLPRFFDTPVTNSVWEALVGEFSIFEFLHTPSPYPGMRRSLRTTGAEKTALEAVGWDYFPYGQLSQFREPGRVNINTMPDPKIWRAVQGNAVLKASSDMLISDDADYVVACDPAHDFPDADSTPGFQPFQDLHDVLEDAIGTDSHAADSWRDTDRNAFFRTQTLSRLQNLVTVRSNVYAIWVTVGYFNSSGTEISPIKRNRGFYIFDRSIPVAYERGKDHNVRDAILLRRIIQ